MQTHLHTTIVATVDQLQGCKATELVTKNGLWQYKTSEVFNAIYDLAKDNQLVVLEYTLPNMSYRTKLHLYPGGTTLQAIAGTKEHPCVG